MHHLPVPRLVQLLFPHPVAGSVPGARTSTHPRRWTPPCGRGTEACPRLRARGGRPSGDENVGCLQGTADQAH